MKFLGHYKSWEGHSHPWKFRKIVTPLHWLHTSTLQRLWRIGFCLSTMWTPLDEIKCTSQFESWIHLTFHKNFSHKFYDPVMKTNFCLWIHHIISSLLCKNHFPSSLPAQLESTQLHDSVEFSLCLLLSKSHFPSEQHPVPILSCTCILFFNHCLLYFSLTQKVNILKLEKVLNSFFFYFYWFLLTSMFFSALCFSLTLHSPL